MKSRSSLALLLACAVMVGSAPSALAASAPVTTNVISASAGMVSAQSASAVAPAAGAAGRDYATDTFGDPWDYSNADDLLLDGGPAGSATNASIGAGIATMHFTNDGYVSPLWGGYPGSLLSAETAASQGTRWPATGTRPWPSRPIRIVPYLPACSGSTAPRVAFESMRWRAVVHAESRMEYLRPTSQRIGLHGMAARLGWLDQRFAGWRIAGGRWQRLPPRLVSGFRAQYRCDRTVVESGRRRRRRRVGPGRQRCQQHRQQHQLGGVGQGLGYRAERSTFPVCRPAITGSAFVGRTASRVGQRSRWQHHCRRFITPNVVGDRDYATTVLGDPWDLNGPADVSGVGGSTNLVYDGQQLAGTNVNNDPFVNLRVGSGGIDGRVYRNLTVTSAYDGPFDLRDIAGGGTMARVMWAQDRRRQRPDQRHTHLLRVTDGDDRPGSAGRSDRRTRYRQLVFRLGGCGHRAALGPERGSRRPALVPAGCPAAIGFHHQRDRFRSPGRTPPISRAAQRQSSPTRIGPVVTGSPSPPELPVQSGHQHHRLEHGGACGRPVLAVPADHQRQCGDERLCRRRPGGGRDRGTASESDRKRSTGRRFPVATTRSAGWALRPERPARRPSMSTCTTCARMAPRVPSG